ncbi:unnamed protein product [Fusarium graminearum]|nr:unnamed protein product [Fusarium graminearum]
MANVVGSVLICHPPEIVIMAYRTLLALGLATVTLALPTDKDSKQGLVAGKFIVALTSCQRRF